MAISNNYLYAIGGFQDSINFGGTSLFNNGKDVFIQSLTLQVTPFGHATYFAPVPQVQATK
ncbi:MAG: hypothetical protein IPP71_18315 [Bacteroidetes bacterium]|nr:hypothetical protein [Bacteroidota bacterium]